MANIRPSSDLRNHYNEISEFCNKYNEPVYITKNGRSDLVVISNAEYERLSGKDQLYYMIDKGYNDMKAGRGRALEEVTAELEKKYGFDKV
ncbi:MAG: type II toxin-antitoxin system prevent-host-death family antitoxin [Clostridia bacterium]|nr:type II toxin-antitoxin system prevent-host-death family antitoxin [Clostridia bacterium]MBR2417785.1 type II toxin-antitoxin system prevent-host-death family antitoxin [Clostridia bacterium]